MNFDVEEHLSPVQRSVESTERDGKPAKTVIISRSYQTSLSDLWDALTQKKRIQRWFLPISGDLKLGASYQFEGNAGGKIIACNAPDLLSVTWEWQGDVSWVEVRLTENCDNSTQLILAHTALVSDFWTEFGPGATGVGWELGLMGLAMYCADSEAPKMDEEEFSASTEGKSLMTKSSEAWGQASIAAGTSAEEALTAARKTTAFYVGEEPEPN